MASLRNDAELSVRATSVRVTDDEITVALNDGRTITVPTAWYPRLQNATPRERSKYVIDRVGVTWPDLDADFSIKGLLAGQKSGESLESFGFWLANRRRGRRSTLNDFLKHKRQSTGRRKTVA